MSTGVGLANIRDRLSQAYGDDHRFEIRNPPEGGFTVIIEIPYEPATPPESQMVERPSSPPAALAAEPPAHSIGISAA